MEATFSNLQVLMRDVDFEDAGQRVKAALQTILLDQGYTTANEDDATLQVVVSARGGVEWVAVHLNDSARLSAIITPVTTGLNTSVVHLELSNDVTNFRLYSNGNLVDTLSADGKTMLSGNPELWSGVLPYGTTIQGILTVLQPNTPESRENIQNTVDNAVDSILNALFGGNDAESQAMRNQVKQFMPDALNNMFGGQDTATQYRDLADLLSMDQEFVHMTVDDFEGMDENYSEFEDDDTRIAFLYFALNSK
jgi:hypothetical protein